MKTTIDIQDDLMARAKAYAAASRRSLRSLVEEGLSRVLDEPPVTAGYRLPDRSVGNSDDPDPLEKMSWAEQRELIYDRGPMNHDRD